MDVFCLESGNLQSASIHPTALDKIRQLEAPRAAAQAEAMPEYDLPTFTEHLKNMEVEEKSTVILEAKVEPSKDPTMKIGKV